MANFSSFPDIDPSLKDGPIDLTGRLLGEDVLEPLFRANEALAVEEFSLRPARILLRDLVAFNEAGGPVVPPIVVPSQVRLIDTRDEAVDERRFVLSRVTRIPRGFDVFELKPVRPVERAITNPLPAQDEFVELEAVLEAGTIQDIDAFLASIQYDRESKLLKLRRLAEVHRDGVQNAVDILQTKRIDFLENPQEAGVEGSIMAFVVSVIADKVITSVAGSIIELVATGVFAVVGRFERKRANQTITDFIRSRHDELEAAILSLKRVQSTRVPEGLKGPLKSKNRLQNVFRERIGELKRDVKKAKTERNLLGQGLIDDSMRRARDLRVRLTADGPNADEDELAEFGKDATDKASSSLSGAMESVTQTKADASKRLAAMPLDVAMKLEVQTYFDPWLEMTEDGIFLLKQARSTLQSVGNLPEATVDEILNMVLTRDKLEQFEADVAALTNGAPNLRADVTAFYELLLWLTLYRPRLSRVTKVTTPSGRQVDALPFGDTGTMNLLKYLALRFFGKGRIEGEGDDAKLKFEDEELLIVFRTTERLCSQLFPAPVGQTNSEEQSSISKLLQSVRFVVLDYAK